MNKESYTYRIQMIVAALMLSEIIFWVVYFVLTSALGAFSSKYIGERLAYKFPDGLWFLLLLIPFLGVFIWTLRKRNSLMEKNMEVAKSLVRPVSSLSSFMKFFLFRNAFVFLILTMAQPIFGTKKIAGTSESLELVVTLDVSNSMNARDISAEASRLDISKRAIVQLINNLHGEKIGINLFANTSYVHLPITQDYGAAKIAIEDIESDLIRNQGTNIISALGIASDMFSEQKTTKAIILITDGENHEGGIQEVIKKIKEKNIQVCVLGIGTKKGGLVPRYPNQPERGYKTTASGKTVVSKLNQSFIQDIAAQASGHASFSSDEFPDLSGLLTEISKMK